MANDAIRGRFVWHELMTPDSAEAHAFYRKALGWKTQAWEPDPSYSMFAAPSGPLGAAVATPSGPSHWVPYVGTPDVDATVKRAEELGATVAKQPADIPNGSRYALLNDPQGAAIAVYQSATALEPESAPRHGEFSWHELAATDYRSAFRFYQALFGWDTLIEQDMGPAGVYLIFGRNGTQLGGMFNKGSFGSPGGAYWLGYVRVKDLNATVGNVKSARGSLVHGPMEVPTGDWIAQFTDSQGALFAVHTLAADVKGGSHASDAAKATKKRAKKTTRKKVAKKVAKKAAKKVAKKATTKKSTKKKVAKKKSKKAVAKTRAKKRKKAKSQAARKKTAKRSAKGGGRKKRAAQKGARKARKKR